MIRHCVTPKHKFVLTSSFTLECYAEPYWSIFHDMKPQIGGSNYPTRGSYSKHTIEAVIEKKIKVLQSDWPSKFSVIRCLRVEKHNSLQDLSYRIDHKALGRKSQFAHTSWAIKMIWTYVIDKALRIITYTFLFAEEKSVPNYLSCFELPSLTVHAFFFIH